eukprot:10078347-Ditylum_brightwellii.AAC.1
MEYAFIIVTQKIPDQLLELSSVTYAHSITSKNGILVIDLTADCCTQVQHACYKANNFHFKYGYSIPVPALAQCMCWSNRLQVLPCDCWQQCVC